MSVTIHRYPEGHEQAGNVAQMIFSCDAPGCDASPSDDEIIFNGGLLNMGWLRRFNSETRAYEHFCPAHKEENSGN